MAELFKRSCRITVGTTQVTGLAMRFEIKKSLKVQANSCVVRITNLSLATRKALESQKTLPCQVEAGYAGALHTLFLGQVRRGSSVRSGNDIVTSLSAGDSDTQLAVNRSVMQLPKHATPQDILIAAGKLLGANAGNIASAVGEGNGTINPTQFHGMASDNLTQAARSMGLEYSVQDGALQVLPIGKPISTAQIVSLSPSSGLIGSPSVDNHGVVTARSLIQPDLLPGRAVRIDALGVTGTFRIEEVTFTGDTWGQDWYVDIHAKRF